jgi:hypothetical protein
MNERILELAKQAGIKANSEQALSPQEQLFAELIVQECDIYARRNWEHGALLGGDLLNLFGVRR